jgi:hypothetical protein
MHLFFPEESISEITIYTYCSVLVYYHGSISQFRSSEYSELYCTLQLGVRVLTGIWIRKKYVTLATVRGTPRTTIITKIYELRDNGH